MKLKSFGCSFIYGSDLADQINYDPAQTLYEDPTHSLKTWPALMAEKLGLEYECYALCGIGNFKILCDIVCQASLDDPAVFVINWTWMDRFDFVDDTEQWQTVRPGQSCDRSKNYYKHFHSHIKDMMSSIYNINSAVTILQDLKIPFVMTYMDYNILSNLDPNYHDPKYVSVVQKRIRPFLLDFENKNFLDWSRHKGYRVSDLWHPLEEAHEAAAELMLPVIDATLHKA